MNTDLRLLNEREVARMLGFHVQTLRNQRFNGTGLPYLKIGRAVRYDLFEIQAFLEERRNQAEGRLNGGYAAQSCSQLLSVVLLRFISRGCGLPRRRLFSLSAQVQPGRARCTASACDQDAVCRLLGDAAGDSGLYPCR